jgi:hypothetical protein
MAPVRVARLLPGARVCSGHGKSEGKEPHNGLYGTYAHVLLVALHAPADNTLTLIRRDRSFNQDHFVLR